jgi:hypothetical protein
MSNEKTRRAKALPTHKLIMHCGRLVALRLAKPARPTFPNKRRMAARAKRARKGAVQ